MVNTFFGEAGIPYLIVYDQLGTMLSFATYGSIILALYGTEGQVKVFRVMRQALLFPPTLALIVGLGLRFCQYPDALVNQLQIVITSYSIHYTKLYESAWPNSSSRMASLSGPPGLTSTSSPSFSNRWFV